MPSLAPTIAKLRKAIELSDDPNEYKSQAESIFLPTEKTGKQLSGQLNEEWSFMETSAIRRLNVGLRRLKLYNNQARKDEDFGDPLMFSNHQTVLAALYYDHLQLEAEARTERDEDCAASYNYLAGFDYDEMNMAQVNYEWDWDTTAWGTGLLYLNEFDLRTKTPIPQVWDYLTFLRDPSSKSVNGDNLGQGAMRFGGREVWMSKAQMKANPEYFNLQYLRKPSKGSSSVSLMEAERLRAEAQGRDWMGNDLVLSESAQFPVRQSLTVIGGKKFIIESVNESKVVIRITPIENKRNRWPIIERKMYPVAHTWDAPGVFDFTEDKQRFRAMLVNIWGKSAKAELYPMYQFDATKLPKEADLKFGYQKFIPFNGPVGDNTISPLRKFTPSSQGQFILEFLDLATQRALATPDIRQGLPNKDAQTLGETKLQTANVDTRYSLTARVWGWSEKQFWDRHYEIYEENFEEGIHLKEVKIQGADGPDYKEYGRKDIIATHPDGYRIKIESKELSEAIKMRTFNQMTPFLTAALQDPNTDKTYSLREWGKLILPKYKIERMIPLTVDELQAREENDMLSQGKTVEVSPEQNHIVHLRENAKAEDTPATRAHLKAHREAMIIKRMFPQNFPQMPGEQGGGAPGALASSAPAMINSQQQTNPATSVGSGTQIQ